ncbi:MAG: dihydrofolate reductase family protein [Kofleriaceae bacterium]
MSSKLILKMSMSLDGFVAGPNGELDWLFRSSDAGSQAWTLDVIGGATMHAMGRKTWNDMTAFWPYAQSPFAAPMNKVPKVVFTRSRTLSAGATTQAIEDARKDDGSRQAADPEILRGWQNPRVASGDIVASVRALKAETTGTICAHGGATFVRSLIEHDLIDEYYFAVHPVVLGRGLPIFTDARLRDLELVDSQKFAKGVVTHSYKKVVR